MKTKNILTIIIILIILTLLLLAGMIAPRFWECKSMTRWDLARPKMASIESAIDTYKLNTGKLPNKLDDLVSCSPELENIWKGPYLKKSQLYDPWDRPYIYDPNGKHNPGSYDIISYGADGEPRGEGYDADIYND